MRSGLIRFASTYIVHGSHYSPPIEFSNFFPEAVTPPRSFIYLLLTDKMLFHHERVLHTDKNTKEQTKLGPGWVCFTANFTSLYLQM